MSITILSIYKPPGKSSLHAINERKREYPRGTKIGHFGTLDPFASGLLLVGIEKATKLNDYVHQFLPKSYLAVGKLGVATASGDYTTAVIQSDRCPLTLEHLGQLTAGQIQQQLQSHFLGRYLQVPPAYSACKFAGKALHRWAREEGIMIRKDPVERTIYALEVVKYHFPYLSLRVTASSGTYVRTLFSDVAQLLGTCGHLLGLVREKIGTCHFRRPGAVDPCALLPFAQGILPAHRLRAFTNGLSTKQEVIPLVQAAQIAAPYLWLRAPGPHGQLLGLAQDNRAGEWQTVINFANAQVPKIPSSLVPNNTEQILVH